LISWISGWHHGLANDIIWDWWQQFILKFWRSLFEILKVDMKLSYAFHSQTKSQTDSVNQVLKEYLCCNINYLENDWTLYLPLAEFSYDNTLSICMDLTNAILYQQWIPSKIWFVKLVKKWQLYNWWLCNKIIATPSDIEISFTRISRSL